MVYSKKRPINPYKSSMHCTGSTNHRSILLPPINAFIDDKTIYNDASRLASSSTFLCSGPTRILIIDHPTGIIHQTGLALPKLGHKHTLHTSNNAPHKQLAYFAIDYRQQIHQTYIRFICF